MQLTDLRPAPYNPRKIDDKALTGLARSIGEFGDISGIVWNKRSGHLVTGHQRLAALSAEHGDGLSVQGSDEDGWAIIVAGGDRVPIRVVDWDDNRERAANVTANNERICGTWDYPSLEGLLTELKATEFGELFPILRLDEFLNEQVGEGLTDPDEVPEPPAEATTKPGDLWTLGDHRLLCGDSASAVDVDRLLDGAAIHLCNTDPPYNVHVEPRSNNARAAGSKALPAVAKKKAHLQGFDDARHGKPNATTKTMRAKDRTLQNDFMTQEDFDEVLRRWFGQIARTLLPGRCFFVWGGYANWANYCTALDASGLYFSQGITWVKHHPVLGRKDFMNDCEHCWYGWREGAGHRFHGPSNVSNVWEVKKVAPQSMIHLTEKPVELAIRAIQYSSQAGENVLDLFGGSGSTLIAAEQTGRRAFLMELDPLYCDVLVQRWQNFTGKKGRRQHATRKTKNAS